MQLSVIRIRQLGAAGGLLVQRQQDQQMAGLAAKIQRCRENNELHRSGLSEIEGIGFMLWDGRGEPNGWLTVAMLDPQVVGVNLHELFEVSPARRSRLAQSGSRCISSRCSKACR